MSEKSVILGINCGHDAAACLVIDGRIEIAIAEERLTRVKHQEGFPILSVSKCINILERNKLKKIDFIIQNQMQGTDYSGYIRKHFSNFQVLNVIINPSHHLLHACYAISASGFKNSAILVVDGSGYSYGEYIRRKSEYLGSKPGFDDCFESLSSYYITNNKIQIIEKNWGIWQENSDRYFRFPSLGHMYSLASQHIFGSWLYAGKVMGLASFGDPNLFNFDIVSIHSDKLEIDVDWILEIPSVKNTENIVEDPVAPHLAAKVQQELEKAMLYLTRELREKTQCENLCISGGVGLNTVSNGKIANEEIFKNIFITPAAQDSGVALGGAAYGFWQLMGRFPDWSGTQEFMGITYSEEIIIETLQNEPNVLWEKINTLEAKAKMAAEEIAEGKIIAWFEGKSEFGPRALGHRSILADARNKETPNILNKRVKFREVFRPFAAAVLEEKCGDFFQLLNQESNPWMMFVYKVKEQVTEKIPGVIHVDKSCRIQTVPKNYEGKFRTLIEIFYQLTGIPLIVNTSFNVKGEPICETPYDALRTFLRSGIDVLYIENYRVTKNNYSNIISGNNMKIPLIHEDFHLKSISRTQNGCISKNEWFIADRYGWEKEISEIENEALMLCDGKTNVSKIFQQMKSEIAEKQFLEIIESLYNRGVIYFKINR